MKNLLSIFAIISMAVLSACGGSDEASSSNSDYYIEFGDNLVETNNFKDFNYVSDGIADVTTLKLDNATLEMYGFHNTWKADPKSIKGKTFDAKLFFSEETEGKVTISEVGEGKERSIGFDHKVKGSFESNDGKKGVFSVSIMHVPMN